MSLTKASVSPDNADIPDFNRTQLHIMQILWDAGEALKPSELESRFEWSIENATLRSVLAILVERGDLIREKRGIAYYYSPKKRKGAAVSEILSGLARLFGTNSRVGLLSQLMEEEFLSEEEIRQLQELAQIDRPKEPESKKK